MTRTANQKRQGEDFRPNRMELSSKPHSIIFSTVLPGGYRYGVVGSKPKCETVAAENLQLNYKNIVGFLTGRATVIF